MVEFGREKEATMEKKGRRETRESERREGSPIFLIRKEGGCVWFGEIRLVHFNL